MRAEMTWRGRGLTPLLLLLPACTWDWDRFDSHDDGGADGSSTTCRWDDPGKFTLQTPWPLTEVNSSAMEIDPFLSPDRRTLYFASERGDGQLRSYRAIRAKPDGPFDRVEEQSEINLPGCVSRFALSSNTLSAFISARSDYPKGCGGRASLFAAKRGSVALPFTRSQFSPIGQINTAEHEWDPFPSHDGLRLYYVEEAPSKSSTRLLLAAQSGGAWPVWERRGPVPGLSLEPHDADNPAVTADERLIVFSADLSGSSAGSRDLWYAVRLDRARPFGTPRPLPVVNTDQRESEVFITPDGCELYFVRSTGTQAEEIYATRHVPR